MHRKKLKNVIIAAAASGLVVSLTIPNLTLTRTAWTYTEEQEEKDKEKEKDKKNDPESEEEEEEEEKTDGEKENDEKEKSSESGQKKEEQDKSDEGVSGKTEDESGEDQKKDTSSADGSQSEGGETEENKKEDSAETNASEKEEAVSEEDGKAETSTEDSVKEEGSGTEEAQKEAEEAGKQEEIQKEAAETAEKRIAGTEKTIKESAEKKAKKADEKALKEQKKEKSAKKSEKSLSGSAEQETTETAGSGSAAGGFLSIPTGEVVPSPVIYHPFRFWTVAKDTAYAKNNLRIYEERSETSRPVAALKEDGVCYLLKKEKNGWYYVESGQARGFVKESWLLTGKDALEKMKEREGKKETFAKIVVAVKDNQAFAHYRATVYQTVVEKDPAIANADEVQIREAGIPGARAVGTLNKGGLCYIIADRDKPWVYVESGQVRGFVPATSLKMGTKNAKSDSNDTKTSVLTKAESKYEVAKTLVDPEDNKALYYTMTSIRTGASMGTLRRSILQYAQQFIGNPYVWGGTSLTEGADCSGFVQKIFAQYGYFLPRTSAEQAGAGTAIPVEDAMPGDLIFYGNGERIYHVVLYAGNGRTIEAKSEKYGIVSAKVSYGRAVKAVRILNGDAKLRFEIPEGLGSIHTFMGWQKVTNPDTQQYAFRKSTGMTFDKEGFGVVEGRYVIACTTTFGNVGDYVDFYQKDGTVIPCIIGDIKSQNDEGCNEYGHLNGKCMVEFVVDQNTWYGTGHANPGTPTCHPEWHQEIVRVENVGNYYDKI